MSEAATTGPRPSAASEADSAPQASEPLPSEPETPAASARPTSTGGDAEEQLWSSTQAIGSAQTLPTTASDAAGASSATFSWIENSRDVAGTPATAGAVTISATVVDADTHAPISGFRVAATRDGDAGEDEIAHATTAADGTFSLVVPSPPQYVRLVFVSGDGSLYVTATGYLSGAQRGYGYDVGTLGLTPGAELSGSLTLPAQSGSFPVSVSAIPHDDDGASAGDYAVAAGGSTVPWSVIVPAGTYDIQLSDGSAFVEKWWKDASRRADATAVTVTAGQHLGDLDATLSFGTNSISGQVRGPNGAPLSDVNVYASPMVWSGGGRGYSATTDADGRYFFGNVAPDSYRIQFSPERGDGIDTYYGGSSYETAAAVVIPAGVPTARTGIDVSITAGATISGTLPATAAAKVSSVSLRPENDNGSSAYASVGADGSFTLLDVPAGTYRLQFYVSGVTDVWGDAFTVTAGQSLALDLSGYTVELGRVIVTLDLSGDEHQGTVELVDATTRAVVSSAYAAGGASVVTLTARPGDYIVRLHTYNPDTTLYYGGGYSPDKATRLTIVADTDIPITITGGTGTLSGRVTGAASGAGVAGATVKLYRAESTGSSTPVATVTSGSDGVYTFTGLAENNYAVFADASADPDLYVPRWFGGDGSSQGAIAVALGDGATYTGADIALTVGGGIGLTFPDAVSVSPTTSLTLYITSDDYTNGQYEYGTVASLLIDGGLELRGLAAGSYRISGSLGGSTLQTTDPITVVAGQITTGVAVALPAAQITGTLTVAATGKPIAGRVEASWPVTDQWGTWSYSTSTYADYATGAYRLAGIPAGASVTLKFSAAGLSSQWWEGAATASAATPIVLGPAGSAPVVADAALQPGIVVSGRFIDAVTGQPAAGVTYYDDVAGGANTSGSDGSFTFTLDSAGSKTLATSPNSTYTASSTTLEVPAGGLTGQVITLQRGYSISGTVAAANNGVPLSGLSVRVTAADGEWSGSYTVYTNPDGSFTIPAREPGRYKLQIENWNGLYVSQWFDGVSAFSDARVIDVVDAPVTGIDVRMSLGGTVSGTIVDAHGQPLAGATVGVATAPDAAPRVAQRFSSAAPLFTGTETANPILDIETRTDANGNFVLPPLEPGDYTLYVYTPETGTTWYQGKSTRAEADVIHIGAGSKVVLPDALEVPDLASGDTPRTPEQSLSDTFGILTSPASQSVKEGDSVTFVALATGNPVPSVQWQRQAPGSQDWVDVDGATSTRLTATAALADDGSSYRAIFTQGSATLETEAATLAVTAAATAPAASATPTVSGITTTGATLTWTAPADGGSVLTGYELVLYAAGSSVPLRTISLGAVTTSTLGLDPGTAYEVTVAAKNAVGTGAASARAAFTTMALTAPATVTRVTAAAASATGITVGWQAPASDGGSPVTGYVVTATSGADSVTVNAVASARSTTVSGLTPDTAYTVTVAATNAIGVGPTGQVSARTDALPPVATVPGAPTDLQAMAITPTSIQLEWKAPASDGGSALTGYTIAVSGGKQLTVGPDTPRVSVGDLTAQTEYTFTVAATNAVGAGAASTALTVSTTAVPVVVPGAPQNLVATATSTTTAAVTWQAPAGDGGAPITAYDVVVLRGGQPVAASITATGTTAAIGGLLPETTYIVTVAARNSAGAGEIATSAPFATPDVVPVASVPSAPGAPRSTAVAAGSITLAWDAPSSDGGSPITGYLLTTVGGTSVLVASNSYVVEGLTSSTAYTFRVQAVNAVGASPFSADSAPITTAAAGGDSGGPGSGGGSGAGGGSLPSTGPATPVAPSESALNDQNRGEIVLGRGQVVPGGALTLAGLTPGVSYATWFFSTPVSAGIVTANTAGVVTVTVPTTLPAGVHRVVLTDPATGAIVGWSTLTVAGLPATGVDLPVGGLGAAALLLSAGIALVLGSRRGRSAR